MGGESGPGNINAAGAGDHVQQHTILGAAIRISAARALQLCREERHEPHAGARRLRHDHTRGRLEEDVAGEYEQAVAPFVCVCSYLRCAFCRPSAPSCSERLQSARDTPLTCCVLLR